MTGSESNKTLTLAPFEHYMLADDSADCPMCFYLKVRFSGRPIRGEFAQSARDALARHPLLRSCVRGPASGRTRDLRWEVIDSPELTISWHSIEELLHLDMNPQIDLQQEIGLRLFLFDDLDQNESTLVVQAHHACTDATGILQFVSDLLVIYGSQEDREATNLRTLDHESVHHRSKFGTTRLQWLLRSGKDARRLFKFARNSPDKIASRLPGNREDTPSLRRPCHCDTQLNSDELAAIRQFAKIQGVSVNDVLLHCLFRTLHQWNQAIDSAERKVRIGMAINLRSAEDVALPAMNLVSLAFVNRPESVDRIAALQDLAEETRFIKHHRMGLLLCRVVSAFGQVRGGMHKLLKANRSVATSILSNLGDPFAPRHAANTGRSLFCSAARDMTIERVDLLPPLRKNIDAVFGVVTHKGSLNIALHFNPECLTMYDAEELLAEFCQSLRDEPKAQ